MITIYRHGQATILPTHQADVTDATLAWVSDEAGLGAAPLIRLTQAGPLQHGASDFGVRLQPRTFTLILGMQADDYEGLAIKREALLALLSPTATPLELRWPGPGGSERALHAHLLELDTPSEARVGTLQRIAATFIAPDPTFVDPVGQGLSFGIAAGGGSLTVPVTVPVAVGSSVVDQTLTLAYPGSWRASPIITIAGPIISPLIENQTTGQVLDFTGTTIAAGDRYTIDTRYGYATVTDAAGTDRTAALADTSDLATFVLASVADVPDGLNTLRARGTGATAQTQVFVQYHARYVGR